MSDFNDILLQYTRLPDNLFALLSRYHVAIPGIQRHYVQGADTPKAQDVRENFIQSFFDAYERENAFHLHFVYGPIDTNGEDTFTPVDGQQRLTTLWLLARYTAERLGKEKKDAILPLLSRFSYTDRINATRFCRALTEKDCAWEIGQNPMISIPRQNWFWDYWMQDETVSSMLRMLSTIHEKWESADPEKLLNFLVEKATFSLQIDSFADDIYMKMNARGLQLTQWENFKGTFAEQLSNPDKGLSIRDRWNQEIEKLSSLYFERSGKNLPDNAFIALLARLAVCDAELSKPEDESKIGGQIKELAQFTNWKRDLPYVALDEVYKCIPEKDSFAADYLNLLDFILRDKIAILSSPYWQTKKTLFQSVFEPQNQNELDLSWLLFAFCRKNGNEVKTEDFTKALRCMWNILENVSRNSSKPSERLQTFHSNIIEKCGPSLYGPCDILPGSSAIQWNEERGKAGVYQSNDENNIKLLQEAEENMHGRVRLGILNLQNNAPCFSSDRLKMINKLFESWEKEAKEKRKIIVLNIVAAEPYNLLDPISLSLQDNNLLRLLTTQDDKSLQENLLNITTDKIPESPFVPYEKSEQWQRDWRKSILKLAQTDYSKIENTTVHWHSSGIYALYTGATIRNSLPINDWRIEIMLCSNLMKWYNTLGNHFGDIRANDGETHSGMHKRNGHQEERLYFWKDKITVSPEHHLLSLDEILDTVNDDSLELFFKTQFAPDQKIDEK